MAIWTFSLVLIEVILKLSYVQDTYLKYEIKVA